MGEVLPKRREVFIDMIYVMFGLMAFTMIFNLACLILSLIAVFGILFYMRPPKSWGRLLSVSYTHLDVYKRQGFLLPEKERLQRKADILCRRFFVIGAFCLFRKF